MREIFLAHIHEFDNSKVQSCSEHLRNTARYAADALSSLNLKESAYLAGLTHDMGKFKASYQTYLKASANN